MNKTTKTRGKSIWALNEAFAACIALVALTSFGAAETATDCGVKPIPAFILGQNIEHTRSAVQGGLSAQLVRNRKFAGRPQRNGIAMMWEPCRRRWRKRQALPLP